MQSDTFHGITRKSENVYDIYVRSSERRDYKRTERPNPFNVKSAGWWKGGVEPKCDSQRRRCYRAEFEVRPQIQQRAFPTLREIATFYRNIMESDWFQRRFPRFFYLRIEYRPGTQKCWAQATEHSEIDKDMVTRGWIALSSWGTGMYGKNGGELILIHELAHAIIPDVHHHDRRWARTFLEMVYHFMGREVGDKLEAAFKKHGVKYKVVRQISEAQRAAAAARFAAYRASRKVLVAA
jgi:hypothetical protein